MGVGPARCRHRLPLQSPSPNCPLPLNSKCQVHPAQHLITDMDFWVDVVNQTEQGHWKTWTFGGVLCTVIFFGNVGHAAGSFSYFAYQKYTLDCSGITSREAPIGRDFAIFILKFTVALVVFDVTDVFATLAYGDEPATRTAYFSASFSAISALYGLFGRKKDLAALRNVGQVQSDSFDTDAQRDQLSTDNERKRAGTKDERNGSGNVKLPGGGNEPHEDDEPVMRTVL